MFLYFAKNTSRSDSSFCCAEARVSGSAWGVIGGTAPDESARPDGASCRIADWRLGSDKDPTSGTTVLVPVERSWPEVVLRSVCDSGDSAEELMEVTPVESVVMSSSSGVSFSCERIGESGRSEAIVGSRPVKSLLGVSCSGIAVSSAEGRALVEASVVGRTSSPCSDVVVVVIERGALESGIAIVWSGSVEGVAPMSGGFGAVVSATAFRKLISAWLFIGFSSMSSWLIA
jgi:hypothetical protein